MVARRVLVLLAVAIGFVTAAAPSPTCPANKYPRLNTATGEPTGLCDSCPFYSSAAAGSFSCTCNTSNPTAVTNSFGQTTRCSCPVNSSFTAGKCQCDSGYYSGGTNGNGSLKTCLPVCPADQYPVLSGGGIPTGACTDCPADSTSSGSTASCSCSNGLRSIRTTGAGQTTQCSCPTGANRVNGVGPCVCGSNYITGGNNADGSLKTCYIKCPANQYPATLDDGTPTGQCSSCPLSSTSTAGSTECTCNAGFYPAATLPAGMLRYCYPVCAENQYPNLNSDSSPADAGGCTSCPPRSTSSGTSKSCSCNELTTTGPTNAPGQVQSCTDCQFPYTTSADGTTCVLPASPAHKVRERRQQQKEVVLSLCPSGLDACSIISKLGAPTSTSGYECLSLQDELEHCGACGNSCLEIPGVDGVRCAAGRCEVSSCAAGYKFHDLVSGSCVPHRQKKTKQRPRTTKLKSM